WQDKLFQHAAEKNHSPHKGYVCPNLGGEIEWVLLKVVHHSYQPFISNSGVAFSPLNCCFQY
ncbi:hypothetical protein O9H85_21695, partial [Paenibacillus filicis]